MDLQAWKSDREYAFTKDSFIFSFNDRIENYILSRVMDENKATFNRFEYGSSFGSSDLDILCMFGDNLSKKASYEKSIRDGNKFTVEECELYRIYKF
ncbi:hypothetical protein C1645_816441 [Glomus cerebriforme]|uniref:TLDc domain-containing protein n=1 Tax=Glomus cerebriforme TaxID=658196 RepID=A0A397TE68_9GLOM|nr:hypothetical protein C1645_816441 [Glomus cerebriforme]